MPAPLPLLANAAELATLAGRPAADTGLLAALRESSRRFRSATKNQITLVLEDVLEVDGKQSLQFRLARPFPIVWIHAITVDGVEVPASLYRVNKRNGIVTSRGGVWPCPPSSIEVTYDHGYEAQVPPAGNPDWPVTGPLVGLPESIQSAVLEMAQIILNTDPGVQSKTVLGDSITFGGSAVGVTQSWSDAVRQFSEGTGDES